MKFYITKDGSGFVQLFTTKPYLSDGKFTDKDGNYPCLELGLRPKLGFTIKRGECVKVNASFQKLKN